MASRGRGTPAAPGASGPAELQLPQGPRGPPPPPPPPPRNYAGHNAPRRRRNYPPHTAPRARSRERRREARNGPAMADGRARHRPGLRSSGRHTAQAKAQTGSNPEKDSNSRRSTLGKRRLRVFPDPDNDTPRVMLKRVIQTQPQVSPLKPRISNHEGTEEACPELPSKRVSSMGELQLPDLAAEDTFVTVFHLNKKRKKVSISEFERAADKRLFQNQAQSTLDNTALFRSLRMSVGSLMAPDTVEKRGLLRRPRNHKAIDMEAFEGGVEQNMLKGNAQNYLVDSQSASGVRTAMMTSDAEIVLNNTELFVQPQRDEQSQNKLSALEPQLSHSKTPAQRSKISDAAQDTARLEGLVSGVGTNEGRTQRHSENLGLHQEHIDRMAPVSPGTPANQQEDQQDHSQQSNPVEQVSVHEEKVAGSAEHGASAGCSEHLEKELAEEAGLQITAAQDTRDKTDTAPSAGEGLAEGSVGPHVSPEAEHETAKDVGTRSLDRHSDALSSSEKSGMNPLEEDDEQDVVEDQAIMLDLDDPEEEPAEDESEHPESHEVSMKTPAFVRAAAHNPLLSAPRDEKPAAPTSPVQLLQPKKVPGRSGTSQRKPREPQIARSLIKEVFSYFVKMPVTREAFKIVEKCSEKYFKQLSSDLEAYTSHAGRKTVEMADVEMLMRRQGLVTDKMPLNVLIERHLPLEYRKLLIPVAVSGNKVIP
ncbi:LOW QUALITY PROTEIN: centromere protein T [Chiroxiphia lanceolata]|uniref:LOW QUALITY PROTEIN: centromere protein T n=1 Tax=Chiroxiphia lanceolata TaxID=296741 RepID=UPI0013CEAC75|nr:LOW QUALITY PROTEIN: centromere protein T [Chiroxiphia lanceolata]